LFVSSDEINDKLSLTLSEVSHFAYYLLGKWKLGRCTDDVLILYSVNFQFSIFNF